MKIYDLVLNEYSHFFSNSQKIFIFILYRKMQKENVDTMYLSYYDLEKYSLLSKSTILRALKVAEELGFVSRKSECIKENCIFRKKTKITIKKGLYE